MLDILDRLRLKIQRIPAGSYHTCGPSCTNTDCILVTSRQEIEALRAEREEAVRLCEVHKEDAMREIAEANELAARADEAVALLREIVAWRVAIECVAPELGGVATTLSRIDAFLAADSATHREDGSHG